MLKFSINLDWRWWKDDTVWDVVQSYWFQHRDMEDRVDFLHSVGEPECEGMRAGLCDDFERSEELLRQLLGGSGHVEILRFNVDKVSDLKLQCQSPTVVHRTLIVMLHIGNVGTEFLVEFIQVHSEFSGMNQSHFTFWVH